MASGSSDIPVDSGSALAAAESPHDSCEGASVNGDDEDSNRFEFAKDKAVPKIDGTTKSQQKKQKRWAENIAKIEEFKRRKKEERAANPRPKQPFEEDSTPMTEEERAKARGERSSRKQQAKAEFDEKCSKNATILLDCDWEKFMTEKEMKSLAQQVLYCFGVNKAAECPSRIFVSGATGKMMEQLSKVSGIDTWPGFVRTEVCQIKKHLGSEVERQEEVQKAPEAMDSLLLTCDNTVYLTADTEDILEEIDPNKFYIIGGIVDRNRLKDATLKKACHYDIPARRLPIGECAESDFGSFSKVLTVNHVFQIILEYQRSKSWTVALEKAMPRRHQPR